MRRSHILRKFAGRQFDPRVVDAFVEIAVMFASPGRRGTPGAGVCRHGESMKRRVHVLLLYAPDSSLCGTAQEASSGIDLGATCNGEAVYSHSLTESPRDGAGRRGIPSCCIPPGRWASIGPSRARCRLFRGLTFTKNLNTQGYGLRVQILKANLDIRRSGKRARSWCGPDKCLGFRRLSSPLRRCR